MSEESVETCLKDQALFDKLSADEEFAHKVLKVTATPTFFINGREDQRRNLVRRVRQADQATAEELICSFGEGRRTANGRGDHFFKCDEAWGIDGQDPPRGSRDDVANKVRTLSQRDYSAIERAFAAN
jgi:hypothetical protein